MSGIAKEDTCQSGLFVHYSYSSHLIEACFQALLIPCKKIGDTTFYQVGTVLSDILVYWVVTRYGLKYIIHTLLIHQNIGFDLI